MISGVQAGWDLLAARIGVELVGGCPTAFFNHVCENVLFRWSDPLHAMTADRISKPLRLKWKYTPVAGAQSRVFALGGYPVAHASLMTNSTANKMLDGSADGAQGGA